MADTTMKKWNGTSWETIYPETTVGQIVASGTPGSSNFLRGDGVWSAPDFSGLATETYVDTAVSDLVDSSPATLDTLNELAAALGDDPNFATTVTNSIAGKVSKSGDTMTGNLRVESASFASLILDREGSTVGGSVVQFENNNGIIGGIGAFGNDGLQFRTTDGTQMVIDASNNVGIGTTSPTQLVHLQKSGTNNYLKVDAGNTTSLDSGILLTEYNINYGFALRHNAGSDNFFISHQDNNLAFTDLMTVTYNGNVGIGTTSPSAKLHLSDAATSAVTTFNANNRITMSGDGVINWGSNAQYGQLTWNTNQAIVRAKSSTALHLGANGNSNHMVINTSGNVGIGTTSPGEKLDVVGNVKITGTTTVDNVLTLNRASTAYGATLTFSESGTPKWFLKDDFDGGNANRLQLANGSQALIATFEQGGNVGIGTTRPERKLHVDSGSSGGITIESDNDSTLRFTTTNGGTKQWQVGNYYTTWNGLTTPFIIQPLQSGMDMSLTPVTNSPTSGIVIKNNGNVGIGTTSPSQKLEVNGQVVAQNVFRTFDVNLGSAVDQWWRVARVNLGSGGVTLRGALNNHVESFGTQTMDLTIFGREGNSPTAISVEGRYEVAYQGVGVRVLRTNAGSPYAQYDVYIKTTSYTQGKIKVIPYGSTILTLGEASTTTQPSGSYGVEFDNTSAGQGAYMVNASVSNKIPWVRTQGTTNQSGVNFTLSGTTLFISTTL